MRRLLTLSRYEARIFWSFTLALIPVALALIALTHGVLEPASLWRRHFIENCESFIPIALALITAPLLLVDSEAGMVELSATLPLRAILQARLLGLWGMSWALLLLGLEAMNLLWGPVPFWSGILAAIGPSLFLTALAVWSATLSGRLAVGYLATIALPVADLILRILGAYAAVPPLQLLDTFAYRWSMASPSWYAVKLFMLVVGFVGLQGCILLANRIYRRTL